MKVRPNRLFRGALVGASYLALAAAAEAAPNANLPMMRPADMNYAKICRVEPHPVPPAGVDWTRWTVGAGRVPSAVALVHARSLLAVSDTPDEKRVARRILEELAENAPKERGAALFELANLDLFDPAKGGDKAVRQLRRALALGYQRAAILLGEVYERGLGGQQPNFEQAALYYKLAVQARLEDGALKLAYLTARRNGPQAARQWTALAQQMMAVRLSSGDCSQLRAIAELYLDGRLLPRAPDVAAAWLRAARQSGDRTATRMLGELVLRGDGMPQDVAQGLTLLQEAANAGDVSAILTLARWFRGDYGAEPDPHRARALFEQAANTKPVRLGALVELGRVYRDGLGGEPDPTGASTIFRIAIQLGSIAAMRELGALLLESDPPQIEEGLPLLRQAANQGDVPAAAILGRWLLDRSDNLEVLAEGVGWLDRAAQQGHIGAAKALGRYYADRGDLEASARYWRMAADANDVEGLVQLAALIHAGLAEAGTGGTVEELMQRAYQVAETDASGLVIIGRALRDGRVGEPDPGAAFALFRQAADRNDPGGMREAGIALARGDGVARDAAAGRELLERAVGLGDPGAHIMFARGLAEGWFGAPEPERATQYLEAAARSGSAEASRELGSLHSRGALGPIDPEAALRWWQEAAARGHIEAMRDLANAHAIGFGTAVNLEQSVNWLERAARRGDVEAMRRLAYVYYAGLGVDADAAKAEHWIAMARASRQAAQPVEAVLK